MDEENNSIKSSHSSPPTYNEEQEYNDERDEMDEGEFDNEKSSSEKGEEEEQEIDISMFFDYQRAINSLIDYLNLSIEEMIVRNPRSDQILFKSPDRKLILNAILESGFYSFCQMRLEELSQTKDIKNDKKFLSAIQSLQGEMDLLAYLLVSTRLAHRSITFDLYLSMLKGGLFEDIMRVHKQIVDELKKSKLTPDKSNIGKIRKESGLYI